LDERIKMLFPDIYISLHINVATIIDEKLMVQDVIELIFARFVFKLNIVREGLN